MNFNEVFQSIEQGIRDVYDSDKYQSYLETMAHFHSYSLNNCMLIGSSTLEINENIQKSLNSASFFVK